MAGALHGITVIELAGIGPGPFAGMMLADHGARVIRIERPGPRHESDFGKRDAVNRNREIRTVDLKDPAGLAEVLALVGQADALIDVFRPGVIERLGLGPDVLLARNPRLVVGRMSGFGQTGPRALQAGHDINYIALSGALSTYGRKGQPPVVPANAVGDYAGGGMMLAFGLLAAILSARSTGMGQVVDCAMSDGAALISAFTYSGFANDWWKEERESNVCDGGAFFYDTYETADGKYVSIGAIEPQFYGLLLDKLGLADDPAFADPSDRARWPELKQRVAAIFRSRTRDAWCALLDHTETCFAPVLSLSEAPHDPHNIARGTFVDVGGVVQPAPAPRFSLTPAPPVRMPE